MPLNHAYHSNNSQSGFAMIEVLVTAIVFAIGISGMGVLLLKTIQGTQDNAQRSQGMWIVQDFIGRIRANPEGAKAGNYVVSNNPSCTTTPTPMCADHIMNGTKINGVNCTPNEMAIYDIWTTMCGVDNSDITDANRVLDSPAKFVVNPELTSTCNYSENANCYKYTVSISWDTRIAKGAVDETDRNYKNNYTMTVELN